MLLRKCANQEPSEEEELEADKYTDHIEAYCPGGSPDSPSVNMSTAVALVNRYAQAEVKYTNHKEACCPGGSPDSPSVSMSTAVVLVNRYTQGEDKYTHFTELYCPGDSMSVNSCNTCQ
jgi:hypothetical protein